MNNLSEVLEKQSKSGNIAVTYNNTNLSYDELYRVADLNANHLALSEIINENIGVLANNSLYYVVSYWSMILSGNTVVPIDAKSVVNEAIRDIEYCDINWLIFEGKNKERELKINRQTGTGLIEITSDFKLEIIESRKTKRIRKCGDEIALIVNTSGTKDNPKRVTLTHANLISNIICSNKALGCTEDDSCLVALPLYMINGNTTQLLLHTYTGGKIVLFDEPFFNAKRFCEIVEEEKISIFNCVPTHLYIICQFPHLKNYNLNSLKFISSAGGPLHNTVLSKAVKCLSGTPIIQMYGQSECSPRATLLHPRDYKVKLGSVGLPVDEVEIKIVDEDGNNLTNSETGEICVRGPNVFPGYYKNPEATSEVLKKGWLYTGDLGKSDSQGYLYVVGRKKNVIISNGQNIYPEEIENVILKNPNVEEVVVKGLSHPISGEEVVAYVVLHNHNKNKEEDFTQLFEENLSIYKRPKKIFYREFLEKTRGGKIIRHN